MLVAQALKLVMILLQRSMLQRMMDRRLKKRVNTKPVSRSVPKRETDSVRIVGMGLLGMNVCERKE